MIDTTPVETFAAEVSVLVDTLRQLKDIEPPKEQEGVQGLERWFRDFQQSLRTMSVTPDPARLTEWAEEVATEINRLRGADQPPGPPEEEAMLSVPIPDGTAENDMLRWDHTKKAWVILDAPDADFKVLQRKADDSLGFDWVRAH